MKRYRQPSIRERIIEKSIRLFLRKGFNGTSIQDIMDEVGVSKGAFYWHFKSKDGLLETIIERFEKDFLESLFSHMNIKKDDFLKRFRSYHKYISEYALKNSELCVLATTLAAELTGSGTKAEKKLTTVFGRYINFIESLLKEGRHEKLFDDDFDVNLNAHIIVSIHNGVLLQWYMNRKKLDGASLARTYRDVILYGMVKQRC